MNIPQPTPHPLKKDVKQKGLNLWQLCQLVAIKGVDETKMSRFLNGYYEMPKDVEAIIEKAVNKEG